VAVVECENCGKVWADNKGIGDLHLCPACTPDDSITADRLELEDVDDSGVTYEIEEPDDADDPILGWAELILPRIIGEYRLQRAGDRLDVEVNPPVHWRSLQEIHDELKASELYLDRSQGRDGCLVIGLTPQIDEDEARERIDEVTPDPSPASQCDSVEPHQDEATTLYAIEAPPFGEPTDTPDQPQPQPPKGLSDGRDELHYSTWQDHDGEWVRTRVYERTYDDASDTIDETQILPSA